MFVLGVTMLDKQAQKEVYPRIGPIFGYFELVSLLVLLLTGTYMILENGLIYYLMSDIDSELLDSLRKKLWLVGVIMVLTIIHFIIAMKTNNKERTPIQNFFSRGSSLLIFLLNLWVLHYAIVIRHIL